jgi:hypothetical protein
MAYADVQDLFIEGASPLWDDDAAVRACPGWTVRDLVAHQVHQLAGVIDGTFPIVDSRAAVLGDRIALARQEGWIAEGVALLRGRAFVDVREEWLHLSAEAPSAADALVPDIAVHLFDLLGVTGSTDCRDIDALVVAVDFWSARADERLRYAGYRGLRVEGSGELTPASEDADVVIRGTPFELLRVLVGRRAKEQGRAIVVDAPDDPSIDLVPAYGWRDLPLDE